MTENHKDGGDISSGHGDPKVDGPVSDEKAQQMLHEDGDQAQTDAAPESEDDQADQA